MGSDALVVNSARVSFSKDASNYTEEQNDKLISYLASHGHFTPFTHPQVVLKEKVPIFVARQRFKHTVGFSYNEVSRRYVDEKPEFYTPDQWRGRPVGAKQGSSEEILVDVKFGQEIFNLPEEYNQYIQLCGDMYDMLIKVGVAPEQARMVLPQSMYTEYMCTGSLMAFARAYKLRSDSHSQKEIQDVAKQWDNIIRPLFPKSWSALVD